MPIQIDGIDAKILNIIQDLYYKYQFTNLKYYILKNKI